MVLLKRRLLTAACAALVLGPAAGRAATGQIELDLFDSDVACNAAQNTCLAPTGPPAVPESLRSTVYLSREASQHPGGGLYLFFEISRPGGALAMVELDVPLGGGVPRLSYSEYVDGVLTFVASSVTGRIALPGDVIDPAMPACTCSDGRLELRVAGGLGGATDHVRRITRARFSWTQTSYFCISSGMLDVPEGFDVASLSCSGVPAPTPPVSGGGGGGGGVGGGGSGGSGGEIYVDEGCGGGSDVSDSSGCDSSGSDYGEDGGCEGEGSEGCDGGDTSGCDGADLGEGCSGGGGGECTIGARSGPERCPLRRPGRRGNVTLPFVLVGLLLLHVQARSRR
jgi:hypothetical protein